MSELDGLWKHPNNSTCNKNKTKLITKQQQQQQQQTKKTVLKKEEKKVKRSHSPRGQSTKAINTQKTFICLCHTHTRARTQTTSLHPAQVVQAKIDLRVTREVLFLFLFSIQKKIQIKNTIIIINFPYFYERITH